MTMAGADLLFLSHRYLGAIGYRRALRAEFREPRSPLPSARVGSVRDGAVADGGYPDCLALVCKLVDDAIGPHAQRAQAVQTAAQLVSTVRVALEESQRVLDGVDEGPIEVE